MTVLLFDLLGGSHILLAVLRALHRDPGTIIHVLAEHSAQPVRFSRHAASYTPVESASSPESVLSQLRSVARTKKIDVILPSGVAAMRFVSGHRQEILEFCAVAPVPEVKTMELARNKGRLALHLAGSTIPHPRTIIVQDPADALGFFDTLGGPALLKPFHSAGGRGILRIDHRDRLEAALQNEVASGTYLLQELIPGYDIDCSFLSEGGTIVAHTVQRGMLPGVSTYAAPGGAEYLSHQGAFSTAATLASSLGWSGVAHVDMRCDERDGQVKVLEINPRFWRSVLGSVAAGVNFPVLACHCALGVRSSPLQASAGRYIHESRIALRQMFRQIGRQRPYRFSETVLSESSRDPLPELALLLFHKFLPEAREW